MCGVIGYVGKKPCTDFIYNGLKKLEYRGYDSAGIATIAKGEGLSLIRAEGNRVTSPRSEVGRQLTVKIAFALETAAPSAFAARRGGGVWASNPTPLCM